MSPTPDEPDSGRVARFINETTARLAGWGGLILATIGSILLGLASFSVATISDNASRTIPDDLASVIRASLLIVGISSTLAGVVLQIKKRPTYAQLLREKRDSAKRATAATAALEDALGSLLRRIATHCELGSTHQRVSIYCLVGDRFVLLARHSASTRLGQRGRDSYPKDQGVIGEAWDIGQSTRWNWPADRQRWEDVQVKAEKIPREVVASLRVQARSMMAIRLTHDHDHIGVLVLESEQPRGVGQRNFDRARGSLLLDSAAEIMVSAHPHFPSVARQLDEQQSP